MPKKVYLLIKTYSKAKLDFVIDKTTYINDARPGDIKLSCQLFLPSEYISQSELLSILYMKPKYILEFLS
jgi:hypothetical protein